MRIYIKFLIAIIILDIGQLISINQQNLSLHAIIKNQKLSTNEKIQEIQSTCQQDRNYIDLQDQDGKTILYLACQYNLDIVLIKFLIDTCEASVQIPTIFNDTPLHEAARQDNWPVMKLLLQAGADPRFLNDQKQTPLDFATSQAVEKVFKLQP